MPSPTAGAVAPLAPSAQVPDVSMSKSAKIDLRSDPNRV
jgi:hypothetical protein